MRIADFSIQSMLFGFALLFLAMLPIKNFCAPDLLLLTQLLLGFWQFISAIITTAHSDHGNSLPRTSIRIFWALEVMYVLTLFTLFYVIAATELTIAWFFSGWLIAVYYYVLTIRLVFPARRKTFFDVLN